MMEEKKKLIAGKNKITAPAVFTLLGAFIVNLIIGSQLAMGNMTVYFVSYFRYVKGYDVNEDSFYSIQPLMVLIATLFYPLGNMAVDKFNG